MYASIRKIIDANKGCVCLVQVGGFYELYFDQAKEYGPKLGIKVAGRKNSKNQIAMAGFPTHQLQKFVKMLIQDVQVNVAIVDQYPLERKLMDALLHRKVSRIVTPGTLVDETFLNFNQNNYLAAIYLPPGATKSLSDPAMEVGIAWVDVSVGDFYVQKTTLEDVVSDIFRIGPSEIILPKEFQDSGLLSGEWYSSLHELRRYFLRYHQTVYRDLKLQFALGQQVTRKALELFSVREEAAMNMVLSYINVNIPEANPALDLPTQYWSSKYLQMDPRTRESLELTERSTGGRKLVVGTLMSTIRRTVTPSGSRMLAQWLNSPILDIDTLNGRFDFVDAFKSDIVLTHSLRVSLSKVGDFIRSVQRLSFGTGDSVTHLVAIADGLRKMKAVEDLLRQQQQHELWRTFLEQFSVPIAVADCIDSTIELESLLDEAAYMEQPLQKRFNVAHNFVVRSSWSPELASLHEDLEALMAEEQLLLDKITAQINDVDPKLTATKREAHGRFFNVIHVSGRSKLIDALSDALGSDVREKRKGTMIIKPREWSTLQARVVNKVEEIAALEQKAIAELRAAVLQYVHAMRAASQKVDFLDVTASFGVLAHETELVRPRMVAKPKLDIVDGRHVVVESALKSAGDMFVANSLKLGPEALAWMITGPNMGGKSTFLRQNALIVIMAQIGCFVPAKKATIGAVDRIFTRIGASDDLFNDLSTFMVEMVETSNILKNATHKSLAIVDEIGRGTSGKEGLAVAYAAMVHLLQVNRCRTLFATHFGKEIMLLLEAEMVNTEKLRTFRTRILNNDGQVLIDHSLQPGITDRSYALEVAKMSRFPQKAMDIANRILAKLD